MTGNKKRIVETSRIKPITSCQSDKFHAANSSFNCEEKPKIFAIELNMKIVDSITIIIHAAIDLAFVIDNNGLLDIKIYLKTPGPGIEPGSPCGPRVMVELHY